jgi:dephospho-CoA kinase
MWVWVTGLSGTGKSSVAERLRELGHRSVDADDDDQRLAKPRDR